MKKLNGPLLSAFMVAGLLATLIATRYRSGARLREDAQELSDQREQLAVLARENIRLSNLVAQGASPKTKPGEPSAALLRLRGEVTRLRNETETLRQEHHQRNVPSFNENWFMAGYDTNGIPDPDLGTPKDEVLSEIRDGRATITSEMDSYVRAESTLANTNGSFVTFVMHFYFDESGKLDTRTIFEK